MTDLEVSDEQVFDHAAAHRVVLHADREVELGAVELTVLRGTEERAVRVEFGEGATA